MKTQILKILCIFCLFCVHLNSYSNNNELKIISSYSVANNADLTIDRAMDLDYSPMQDNLVSLGFLNFPVWVRVDFQHLEASNPYKFLVVSPPRHEDVRLFQVSNDRKTVTLLQSLPSIEKVAFFGESQKNIFMLGNINPESNYYLEIRPYGPMNIQVDVKDSADLESDFHRKLFSLGGAVFSAFIFLLLIGFLFQINREIIYIHFFLHVLATSLVFISTLGFNVGYLTDKLSLNLGQQMGLFMILNISSSLLLFSNILKLMRLPRWLGRYVYCIPAVNLVFLVWFLGTSAQDAWLYSSLFGIIFSVIYGASFLWYFDKRVPEQWVLAIFSSVIYFLLLLILLAMHGVLQFSRDILQVNVLRIGFLPVIFGLIFWFYEVVKRNRMNDIEVEKAAESRHLEDERKRRKTYEGFMGMLVHEIKTPLSIIQIASISLGRRFKEPSNESQRLSHIEKSVNDINDILFKCVQVSDIENNTVFVDKSEVEMDGLLDELSTQLKSDRITWDCTEGLRVYTDYILLRTILTNLLTNALKYSNNDSRVLFYGHALNTGAHAKVRLSVTNDIGVAGAPDPGLVFNRYYRGANTTSLPGTGLGLWLSQSIAESIQTQVVMEMFENRISFSIDVEAAK